MKALGIIQCRLGSSRLKKKALLKIGSYKIIEWVIRRVKKSKKLDGIILATSRRKQDKELIKISKKLQINFFSGNEKNVFSRFCEITRLYKPKLVIRICADNPFIDPSEIDKLIKFSEKNYKKNIYAFNHIPHKNNNYIDGVGAECISSDYFLKYEKKIRKKKHLEHVTSFIWENKKNFYFKSFKAPKKYSFPSIKLDIDYNEDYQKFKKILFKSKIKPENFINKTLIRKLVYREKYKPINKL